MPQEQDKFQDNLVSDFVKETIVDPNSELFSQISPTLDPSHLEASYRRLQLIYNLGRAIFEKTELNKVLETVLDALKRLIDSERCFVATKDDKGKLRPVATHNIDLSENIENWPVSKTLITRILQEGISILSSDIKQDSQFENNTSLSAYNIRSIMCVPLGFGDNCAGLIYTDNRIKSGSFSQVDLLFLTALSHYIYLGLRNAHEIEMARVAQNLSDERWAILQNELLQAHQIVEKSNRLIKAYDRLRRVARKDIPILLLGETGTGKELFAKAAHKLSKCADKVFLAVNIAALSENIVESELFGHEKGASSGAIAQKKGRFELADGGTLFLDEVAEIPLHIQPKLLRVLETGEFERVGGTQKLHTNVKLICATNKMLEDAVGKGAFREDLFYRLKGITIEIPALRERLEDIPHLVRHFLKKLGSEKLFSDSAILRMQQYPWPGNVRQLARLVEEMDAVCDSTEVEDLPTYIGNTTSSLKMSSQILPLNEVIFEVEREYFKKALFISQGNNDKAIKLLGISRAKFFDRKKKFDL